MVGVFNRQLLVCDTEIQINGVRWAILHHMMYEPLKLYGVPQAWIVLASEREAYFVREKVNEEFQKKMDAFIKS